MTEREGNALHLSARISHRVVMMLHSLLPPADNGQRKQFQTCSLVAVCLLDCKQCFLLLCQEIRLLRLCLSLEHLRDS